MKECDDEYSPGFIRAANEEIDICGIMQNNVAPPCPVNTVREGYIMKENFRMSAYKWLFKLQILRLNWTCNDIYLIFTAN